MPRLVLPCIGAVLLAGCLAGTGGGAVAADGPTLDGTHWVLMELPGRTLLPGVAVTAQFADGRLSGSDGCNRYAGPFQAEGDRLSIPPSLAATQMACAPEVTAQAGAYVAALGATRNWRIAESRLELRDAQGQVLATFGPQPQSLAGTSWRVTGINNGRQAVVTVLGGTEVTMQFGSDARLAGSAGCNRYTGSYETGAGRLSIGSVASTRMACAVPEGVMAQEQQFLAALATVASLRIEGDRLELRTSAGALAISATRGQ